MERVESSDSCDCRHNLFDVYVMCHYISAQEPIGLFVFVGVYVPFFLFSFYIPCTSRYFNWLLLSRWNCSSSTLHNYKLRGLMGNSFFGKSSN